MRRKKPMIAGIAAVLILICTGSAVYKLHAVSIAKNKASIHPPVQAADSAKLKIPITPSADVQTSAPSQTASTVMQSKTESNLKGIDISHWDGAVDWNQVKQSGVSFVYIKASGGLQTDPKFSVNVKGAQTQGLAVGAYHYAKPTAPFRPDEARSQARYFVKAMEAGGLGDYGNLMPVVDLEEPSKPDQLSPDELANWTRIFVDTVKELTHRQVMLYTGIDFIQKNAGFNGKLSDLPLWAADYIRFGDKQPPVCGGWTHWVVWQYSDQGAQPGIQGQVDLDAGPSALGQLIGE